MAKLFVTSDWSLIPGPGQIVEPFYSNSMDEIAEFSPESIAQTILSFPGTGLLHPSEPTWWNWQARWEQVKHWININMTLFDSDESLLWGGSSLTTSCNVSDIVDLWLFVRAIHQAVWLHAPDNRVFSPESFIAEYAN